MDNTNKKASQGLPLLHKKEKLNCSPTAKTFNMVPSSMVPLPMAMATATSFQHWRRKPYINHARLAVETSSLASKKPNVETFMEISTAVPEYNHFQNITTQVPLTTQAAADKKLPAGADNGSPVIISGDRDYRRKGSLALTLEEAIENELKFGRRVNASMDPRKLRRTISNRLSAQRSRTKKAQLIMDMEKNVKDLEARIAYMSPQVAYEKNRLRMLQMEKNILEDRLVCWTDKSNQGSLEILEKKAEVQRLKELHMMMMMMMMNDQQKEHVPGSSNSYMSSSTSVPQQMVMGKSSDDDGIDQYLNLNALNIDPLKREM